MQLRLNRVFIPLLSVSLVLFACNSKDKKTESTTSKDTSGTTTETPQPVTNDATPDAVTAAPGLYKVLSDSMGIRVLEVNYKPGDSSVLHSHPDYAVYATGNSSTTFYAKDGSKMVADMKTGFTAIRPAELHSVKNNGKTPIKVILFETTRPAGNMTVDAATDATKVAGGLYKLSKDSLGIRVLEINYKPGQSSAMHSHPDNALYVIQGGKAEFTDKDGKKTVSELKAGMVAIRPGESHSVKNVGTTTLKAILVEFNRPMK